MSAATPESIRGPLTLSPLFSSGLVSVIMPSYNSAEFVVDAVNSVLAQAYRPIELFIVDDGSSDESPEILADLAQQNAGTVRIFRQPNRGPYPARNLGLTHAQGEFIAFLDADDYWNPSFLTKLIGALDDSRIHLAYCGWRNLGVEGGFGKPYVPPVYAGDDSVSQFLDACPWPIHAAVLRRELMVRLGGFSERCFTSMDFDLWLRARAATDRMLLVPEVLAFYRWHDKGQISAVKSRQVRDAWQVRKDFVAAYPDTVAHLGNALLREKVNGSLLTSALRAYWQRDLVTAHTLFRLTLRHGVFRANHLRHQLPSLLPQRLYSALIGLTDLRHRGA